MSGMMSSPKQASDGATARCHTQHGVELAKQPSHILVSRPACCLMVQEVNVTGASGIWGISSVALASGMLQVHALHLATGQQLAFPLPVMHCRSWQARGCEGGCCCLATQSPSPTWARSCCCLWRALMPSLTLHGGSWLARIPLCMSCLAPRACHSLKSPRPLRCDFTNGRVTKSHRLYAMMCAI